MKKIINILLVLLLVFIAFGEFNQELFAFDPEDAPEVCLDPSQEDLEQCQEYLDSLTNDQEERQKEIDKAAKDIEKAIVVARGIQNKIDSLQTEIDSLNSKISELKITIDNLNKEIDKNQKEVDNIRSKIFERMVAMQPIMRFNPYIDFMMGSKSFEDLIRRSYGVKQISQHDNETNEKLKELLTKLTEDKKKVSIAKNDLETSKTKLVNKQNNLIAEKYYYEQLKVELLKKQEDLRSQSSQVAANISEIKDAMANVPTTNIINSNGWTIPINGDYWISAGTWYYPSGGRHLGLDFAADVGTEIVSPGNGVVVQSYDGCPTYGYLGDGCGDLSGLGNQVRVVVLVNNKLYGVTIGHMKRGSTVDYGITVKAGEYLGLVGSSGSSTGPHAHVEVVYVGTADYWENQGSGTAISNYINQWDGGLSFGAKRYNPEFLEYACENRSSAPCRLKPETVFGY